jgi:membrane protease subunit HflK
MDLLKIMQDFLTKFSWDHNDGKGPWGKKTTNKPGRKPQDGQNQPDIEDLLRNAQDKMKGMMRDSGGNGGGANIGNFLPLIIIGGLALWGVSGFYKVEPDEEGVVLRLGKYVETTSPGLRYHMPFPLEEVYKVPVTRENLVEIGYRSSHLSSGFGGRQYSRKLDNNQVVDVMEESHMLTGDENIVNLHFSVRWKISDARDYLFNVKDPDDAIKHISESAMREIIGQYTIDGALTEQKNEIQQHAKTLIQETIKEYAMGVQINGVELQQVNPPSAVIESFRDVQAAKADAEKLKNEAEGYANDILPKARGQAAQITQDAEAYKAAKVADATGQAERFKSQLVEYKKAKTITADRLYIETMEEVLKGARKVIMGADAGKGVLPYLPLESMKGGR